MRPGLYLYQRCSAGRRQKLNAAAANRPLLRDFAVENAKSARAFWRAGHAVRHP
jgi:hypothetical protein